MVREKEKKIAVFVFVLCIALSIFATATGIDVAQLGIYQGCAVWKCLTYHFFHANIFHCLCNVWCLLSLVFAYPVKGWQMAAAFIIASLYPFLPSLNSHLSPLNSQLSTLPTVGLSGVCFALMGMQAFVVGRKLFFFSWVIAFIAFGFLFPNNNALLHLYCYIAGLTVGFLNSPAPWQ
jgi:membrane associated rhomboid family serine protease